MSKQSANGKNNPLQQYRTYNNELLFIVAFTLINIVLVLCRSQTYFLFSAYLPYWLVLLTAAGTGYFPIEGITAGMPAGAFAAALVFAAVVIVAYLVLWFFSRKSYIPLVIAVVMMGIDTVAMFMLTGFTASMILDYIFHGVVLYCLIHAILIGRRLKEQGVDLGNAYARAVPADGKADDSFYAPATSNNAAATDSKANDSFYAPATSDNAAAADNKANDSFYAPAASDNAAAADNKEDDSFYAPAASDNAAATEDDKKDDVL